MQKEDGAAEEVRGNGIKKLAFGILAILILLGIGAGSTYYLAKTRPGLIGLPKNTQEQQAEINAVISQVGKLITLPVGETPTIATITDAEKLKDQPFFKNAKNGDKVLVYQSANKAIIYRPSENRIIDVGAVNVASPVPTGESPSPTPAAKFAATPAGSPVPAATP